MSRTFTPKEVAERFGVGQRKVLSWIQSGELSPAVNVVGRLGGKKPRWRIPPEAIAAFERRRSSASTETQKPVRCRRIDTGVKQYF